MGAFQFPAIRSEASAHLAVVRRDAAVRGQRTEISTFPINRFLNEELGKNAAYAVALNRSLYLC
jgi:hypothetical protein